MAFSLSQVQRKSCTNQTSIRQCFAVISGEIILTQNIKYALKQYLNYMLKKRRTRRITPENLHNMIVELLEECCNMSYKEIRKENVEINENEILYQIKKAIYYGATQHIYFPFDTVVQEDLSSLRQDILPPKRISQQENLNTEQVKQYFEEFVI